MSDQRGEKNGNWQGGISKNRYAYKLKHIAKYPEAHRAREIVRKRIARGTLNRLPCSLCQTTERVHAHHEDYSKPLEITWLCHICHKDEHLKKYRTPTVALQNSSNKNQGDSHG